MVLEYKMIDPFAEEQVSKGVISYGLSSYGYDLRLADEFLIAKNAKLHAKTLNAKTLKEILRKRRKKNFGDLANFSDFATIIDPKNFNPKLFSKYKGKECIIPAHSFVLARSLEYFRIPRNILTLCFGKSTYARCGIIVNVTPFEPEWCGYATLEITNTAPYPAKIYALEGIAQVIFLESDEICDISYANKKGRYQTQKKITLPKI